MKSNYKLLGKYIRIVDIRNKELLFDNLIGLSIQKKFIPSISNTIGTDMSSYRIIEPKQFAYCPVTSRNGEKITIALYQGERTAIISQAYTVFEITNTNELLPEYLMLWVSRPEFDRYSRFMSHGSVREMFDWDEMCNVRLPVPSIEKQREIVKEYNTVKDRIELNNRLIQKLEETAQAIYKQWFVDFEFPFDFAQGKPDLNGKPYKSNGGKMVDSELGKIPNGWEYPSIQKLIDRKILDKNQDGNHGEVHPKTTDYVVSGVPFIMAKDIFNGTLNLHNCSYLTNKQAKSLRVGFAKTDDVLLTHKGTMGRVAIVPDIDEFIVLTPQVTYYRILDNTKLNKEYLYCLFLSDKFQNILNEQSEQSTRKFLSILNQRLIKVLLPTKEIVNNFKSIVNPLLVTKKIIAFELVNLTALQEIILSKLATIEV